MIRFTSYAEGRLEERRLPRDLVEGIAAEPAQLLEEGGRRVAQSRYTDARGKEYVLRVIYEEAGEDMLVVTAYQTSKIEKYWRADEDPI